MLIRSEDENGIAMITVILTTFVIVTLSVAVVQLSVHNLNQSSYDRKRDQALQAAQTAVDSYLITLPTTPTRKVCNGLGSGSPYPLSTSPSVTYSVSVAWSTNGNSFTSCPNVPTSKLKSMVVTGTGRAGVGTVVTRKWQTFVNLKAIPSGSMSAFYGAKGLCISNGPVILHQPGAVNSAMLYSGGDINTLATCGSGSLSSGNMVVEGNVYAVGNIDNVSGCVEGDVLAGGWVKLNAATVGGCNSSPYVGSGNSLSGNGTPTCPPGAPNSACYFSGYGNVTAAGGYVSLATVNAYGTCKASGIQDWNTNSRCSSTIEPSGYLPTSCTSPNHVGDGSANCGSNLVTGLQGPQPIDMPVWAWNGDVSVWEPAYKVVTESSGCAATLSDIEAKILSGVGTPPNHNLLFNVTNCPALIIPNNVHSLVLYGNTIIVTTGSFTNQAADITSAPGACLTTATDNDGEPLYPNLKCQFDVIVPTSAVPNPETSCIPPALNASPNEAGPQGIFFGGTASSVDSLSYTPCWLTVAQSSTTFGQGIAGVVNEGNHFFMTFHPLLIQGFEPSGYQAAPVFYRECVAGSAYC